MPTTSIEEGVVLHYEDTGAVDGVPSYTTFVLLHGIGYNGGMLQPQVPLLPLLNVVMSAIWSRMFPHARAHGIRLISMNMRDYTGSTPYSSEERDELESQDLSIQRAAIRRMAREVSSFLVFVCTELKILRRERMEDGAVTGGFVLVSWSLGNLFVASLLGDPHALDDATKATVEPFWRKVVMYGELILSTRSLGKLS